MGVKFCAECGVDIREFNGVCPYCSGVLKRPTELSREAVSDAEREAQLRSMLNNIPPPPGIFVTDGEFPTELINDRAERISSIRRELEEIESRKPKTESVEVMISDEESSGSWKCVCGAESTGTFCRDCGRAKP